MLLRILKRQGAQERDHLESAEVDLGIIIIFAVDAQAHMVTVGAGILGDKDDQGRLAGIDLAFEDEVVGIPVAGRD